MMPRTLNSKGVSTAVATTVIILVLVMSLTWMAYTVVLNARQQAQAAERAETIALKAKELLRVYVWLDPAQQTNGQYLNLTRISFVGSWSGETTINGLLVVYRDGSSRMLELNIRLGAGEEKTYLPSELGIMGLDNYDAFRRAVKYIQAHTSLGNDFVNLWGRPDKPAIYMVTTTNTRTTTTTTTTTTPPTTTTTTRTTTTPPPPPPPPPGGGDTGHQVVTTWVPITFTYTETVYGGPAATVTQTQTRWTTVYVTRTIYTYVTSTRWVTISIYQTHWVACVWWVYTERPLYGGNPFAAVNSKPCEASDLVVAAPTTQQRVEWRALAGSAAIAVLASVAPRLRDRRLVEAAALTLAAAALLSAAPPHASGTHSTTTIYYGAYTVTVTTTVWSGTVTRTDTVTITNTQTVYETRYGGATYVTMTETRTGSVTSCTYVATSTHTAHPCRCRGIWSCWVGCP
jgi:hypothetical protein